MTSSSAAATATSTAELKESQPARKELPAYIKQTQANLSAIDAEYSRLESLFTSDSKSDASESSSIGVDEKSGQTTERRVAPLTTAQIQDTKENFQIGRKKWNEAKAKIEEALKVFALQELKKDLLDILKQIAEDYYRKQKTQTTTNNPLDLESSIAALFNNHIEFQGEANNRIPVLKEDAKTLELSKIASLICNLPPPLRDDSLWQKINEAREKSNLDNVKWDALNVASQCKKLKEDTRKPSPKLASRIQRNSHFTEMQISFLKSMKNIHDIYDAHKERQESKIQLLIDEVIELSMKQITVTTIEKARGLSHAISFYITEYKTKYSEELHYKDKEYAQALQFIYIHDVERWNNNTWMLGGTKVEMNGVTRKVPDGIAKLLQKIKQNPQMDRTTLFTQLQSTIRTHLRDSTNWSCGFFTKPFSRYQKTTHQFYQKLLEVDSGNSRERRIQQPSPSNGNRLE